MKPTQIFPSILIILNFCAFVVCGFVKDWKMTAYWLLAGLLNVVVTFF